MQYAEDGAVGVRLGRGDGSFGPREDLLDAIAHASVVASIPGRVLVWEELPRYAWTGRYTQLGFGESLADPAVVFTELITIIGPSRRDFDDDGDTDVLGVIDGVLTLLEVDDEGWTERELPTPSRGFSTDFATGSFDTVPGMDLLVTDDEDALLVRSFATDPTAAHEPVVYVPAVQDHLRPRGKLRRPEFRLSRKAGSSPAAQPPRVSPFAI